MAFEHLSFEYGKRDGYIYPWETVSLLESLKAYYVAPIFLLDKHDGDGLLSYISKGGQAYVGFVFKKPGTLTDFFSFTGELALSNPAGDKGGSSKTDFVEFMSFLDHLTTVCSDEDNKGGSGKPVCALDHAFWLSMDDAKIDMVEDEYGSSSSFPDNKTLNTALDERLLPDLLFKGHSSVMHPDWRQRRLEGVSIADIWTNSDKAADENYQKRLSGGAYGIDPDRFIGTYQIATTKQPRPRIVDAYTLLDELQGFISLRRNQKTQSENPERWLSPDNVWALLKYCGLSPKRDDPKKSLLTTALCISNRDDSQRMEVKPLHIDVMHWVERLPSTKHFDYCSSRGAGDDKSPFKYIDFQNRV